MNPPERSPRGQRSQRHLRARNRAAAVSEAVHEEADIVVAMESSESYLLARLILRLVAVVTILISAVLVTQTLITLIGMGSAVQRSSQGMQIQMTGMLGQVGFFMVLAQASMALWGFLLFKLSASIAQKIVD